MRRPLIVAAIVLETVLATCCHNASGVELTITNSEAGAKVLADGELYAEYVTLSGHQPIIWPIHGPDGRAMTRAFPMAAQGEHEEDDHPHHRSLWFTHGLVNGQDFWLEPDSRPNLPQNFIRHREFESLGMVGRFPQIVTRNDWVSDDAKLCEDRRVIAFCANEDMRWIDFIIEIKATEGDVAFGDTKEGSFGIRVPGTMKVTAKQGGTFVNSRGKVDGSAWGQPAQWVNYTGPVEGKQAGIAIFCHPDSFRPVCRWHVREYGLYAANPFGLKHFTRDALEQSELVIKSGASLTLRYLVVLHQGDLSAAKLHSMFALYSMVGPSGLEQQMVGPSGLEQQMVGPSGLEQQ